MINIKLIGCGAAGNKAAITCIENQVIDSSKVVLLNTTAKDIPSQYQNNSLIFNEVGMGFGGCGKERDLGKNILLNSIKNANVNLDQVVNPEDQLLVLCGSTEGGTGSSAMPILAKYYKEVLGIHVVLVLFFGFEDDIRGLQNSIEICQELTDQYTVIGISNKKFLGTSTNKLKAEKEANKEFAKILRILSGSELMDSEQNIDDTDLFKIVTTPGYMIVDHVELGKIKNLGQYNEVISNAIDNNHSLDIDSQTEKRLGVIFNLSETSDDSVDFQGTLFRDEYGVPYEYFIHVQRSQLPEDWVEYIACGMDMPTNELKAIYESYIKNTNNVKKTKDNFFDEIGSLKGVKEDSMFNVFGHNSQAKSKTDFLSDFGLGASKEKKG